MKMLIFENKYSQVSLEYGPRPEFNLIFKQWFLIRYSSHSGRVYDYIERSHSGPRA